MRRVRRHALLIALNPDGEYSQTTAEENCIYVLQAMENDEIEPWDVSPTGDISPTGDQDGNPDRGRLTVEASKGLGLAGRVQVPQEMWDRLGPCNWAEAHADAAEQRAGRDIKLAAMIQRVHADGLIDRVQDGRRPNVKAFTKCKSATKGAMIINMVPLNARCGAPGQRIKLPTLEHLGDTFQEAARDSRTMWFCKLDVANMFWSCWMPEEERSTIRIGVMDEVCGFHGLPFGWTHSPVIATELLTKMLAKFNMPGIRPVQYVDDILVYGFNRGQVKEAQQQLWTLLEEDGWLCSPKSQLEPTTTIDWMGKELDGKACSMQSSAGYVAGMVNMWIKLATLGYCQKTLKRLLGKLAWADRPSRETSPHTSGPMAWMMRGPQNAKYTPPRVLKALGQAIAMTIGPWTANRHTVGQEIDMYVDAAEWESTYMVGVWLEEARARLWEAPATV